ncbi:Cops6 protein [Gorgonomyces haynaldii]|nr:Cops6 protein [Gorgonomyces haynaldii]
MSSLELALHPLVILNISDHCTRQRVQTQQTLIFGALLGSVQNRRVEILNSFELPHNPQIQIDMQYLQVKQEQYRQVFPDLELLGWYTTGTNIDLLPINKQFLQANESPIVLLLDPQNAQSEMPIKMFETNIIGADAKMSLLPVEFQVETNEAERIAVDHTHKEQNENVSTPPVALHLQSQASAIRMLLERVKVLLQYVDDAKQGKIPADHKILGHIAALARRLPMNMTTEFQKEFNADYNDVMLLTALSVITKSAEVLNELVEKKTVSQMSGGHRKARGSKADRMMQI